MSIYLILLITIINFIFESTLFNRVTIMGITPNIALILIVIVSLSRGNKTGGFVGLFTGLLRDLVFNKTIGVIGLIYFFIGYAVGLGEKKFSKENIVIPTLMTAASTMAYYILYAVFMFFLRQKFTFAMIFGEKVLTEIVLNGLLTIPLYKWLSKHFTLKGMTFGER